MRDVGVFEEIRAAAATAIPAAGGLIAELLDGCNIECPTCIATSGVLAGNVRNAARLKMQIGEALSRRQFKAILLSGGEPTIHPNFLDLSHFASSLDVESRVLITNGLRFAREPDFAKKFVEQGGSELEIFLQFDSLRPENLFDLRGDDYSRDRINAVATLEQLGVSVTLVNVVKRSVTLDHIDEVLDFARDHFNVVGVQFQPIRDAGRVENFVWTDNSCDISDIFDRFPGRVRLKPCTNAPWSSFVGLMSRSSGAIGTQANSDFYISPTNSTHPEEIRVAVLDYSDRYNWTNDRSRLSSVDILNEDGSWSSVDDYFLGL